MALLSLATAKINRFLRVTNRDKEECFMKKLFIFVILCGLCFSLTAQSRDKPAASQPASVELSAIQTANNLAKYGYSSFSASALITAAEILVKVQTQALGADPAPAGSGGTDGETKTGKPEFTPANLLADAKKYAAGDATLLAWAAKVEGTIGRQTRGALGGPREGWYSVKARSTDTFQLAFTTNRLAEIVVSGDGDTDLDLYVYDANGNLIAYDEDYSDDCYVSWVPAWTGAFTIQIVNRGRVHNRYVIATN
jgi:hypothetical protein